MMKDAIRREGDTQLAQDLAEKLLKNEPCKLLSTQLTGGV